MSEKEVYIRERTANYYMPETYLLSKVLLIGIDELSSY